MPIIVRLAVLVLSLVCVAPHAGAVQFDNAQFDDSQQVEGMTLVLNGVGKRQIWLFDAYHAALYLPRKHDRFEEIVAEPGARVMELRLLRQAPLSLLERVVTDGIARNVPPANLPALQPRIQELIDIMRRLETLKKGDVLRLAFTGEATRVYVNGTPAGEALPGKPFHDALLAIWLGSQPVDAALKARLLGLAVAP